MFGKKKGDKEKEKAAKTLRGKALDFFRACEAGKTNDVHKLLQVSGTAFSINLPNESGQTALHVTAESAPTASDSSLFNYLSICKMLIDAGADPCLGTLILSSNAAQFLMPAPFQARSHLSTPLSTISRKSSFLPRTPRSIFSSSPSSPTSARMEAIPTRVLPSAASLP